MLLSIYTFFKSVESSSNILIFLRFIEYIIFCKQIKNLIHL